MPVFLGARFARDGSQKASSSWSSRDRKARAAIGPPWRNPFKREFYRRVFFREPWEGFVRETVARLKSGALDNQLVYRKRLRQPLDAYHRNVPPHVQAARKLQNPSRVVRHLITVNGPEPISARTSAIDYQRQRTPSGSARGALMQHDAPARGTNELIANGPQRAKLTA